MGTEVNILKLIIAIVLGYAIIFLSMWLFGPKKDKDKKTKVK